MWRCPKCSGSVVYVQTLDPGLRDLACRNCGARWYGTQPVSDLAPWVDEPPDLSEFQIERREARLQMALQYREIRDAGDRDSHRAASIVARQHGVSSRTVFRAVGDTLPLPGNVPAAARSLPA